MDAVSDINCQEQRETMPLPDVGAKAPPFTLPNQDGKKISLSDFTGKNVLIWFYPRAFGNN